MQCTGMVSDAPLLKSDSSYPPINLFYCHYHNCIRSELELLSASVSALESCASDGIAKGLTALKGRVAFLERVYSIHSSVEDEASFYTRHEQWSPCVVHRRVFGTCHPFRDGLSCRNHHSDPALTLLTLVGAQVVYPALDAKVKNVTVAYTVEHEEEVRSQP